MQSHIWVLPSKSDLLHSSTTRIRKDVLDLNGTQNLDGGSSLVGIKRLYYENCLVLRKSNVAFLMKAVKTLNLPVIFW